MVRIIMHGCNGHMGQVISQLVKEDQEAQIVAGIDLYDNRDNGYPVFKSIWDCDVEADAIIDFASPKAEDDLLDYCTEKKVPVVVCTTGLSPEQVQKIQDTSRPVSYTHLGISVIREYESRTIWGRSRRRPQR